MTAVLTPNDFVRGVVDALPLGPFTLEFLDSAVDSQGYEQLGWEAPRRQAMCELERISDGPIARKGRKGRWRDGDESVIFANRDGRVCPLPIWLRNGGRSNDLRRGRYLKVEPGSRDAHWDLTDIELRARRRAPSTRRPAPKVSARSTRNQSIFESLERMRLLGVPITNELAIELAGITGDANADARQKARRLLQSFKEYIADHKGQRHSINDLNLSREDGFALARINTEHAWAHLKNAVERNVVLGWQNLSQELLERLSSLVGGGRLSA